MASVPKNLPKKDGRGKAPKSVKGGNPNWSVEEAIAWSKKGKEVQAARRAARAALLKAVLDGGIVAKTKQAMDTGDAELLAMCDKASRMVGLDHQSSPDYAQRLQVEGNVDAEVKIRVIKDEPKK
jgi:hypothetical protein